MLNFNPNELENNLFKVLKTSNLHVNRVGVMLDATNNMDLLHSLPEEILNELPPEVREDIRLKRLGVRKDSGPVEQQESMVIIDYVRPDGNEIQAVLKESGKIVIHFLKDRDNEIHYNSITKVKAFEEVPIILESQEYFELCECNSH